MRAAFTEREREREREDTSGKLVGYEEPQTLGRAGIGYSRTASPPGPPSPRLRQEREPVSTGSRRNGVEDGMQLTELGPQGFGKHLLERDTVLLAPGDL